ncbi:PREDICTED: beta-1,3-glucan-binding protein-like [Papilio xuthus]|uniref:Beta-1,3-glucan-binding protein-like n=1 Tax=Papilio xuthus TaxID=66420 RepID=A0AAJ6ZHA7_PAPXU|nr:PREDICTED: beta-1,3-glucan-binding protein-like [Papilio xuthus]
MYSVGGMSWTSADVMAWKHIHLLILFVYSSYLVKAYTVPPAKLEAIYPKGLRVSIPDDGFTLFAFHGNLNVEMEGLEAGQWARDITKVKNGRWTFRDRNAELKLGDKIYFWTYVIKNGLGYRQDNGEWTVTEFVNENGTIVDPNDLPPATTTTPSFIPTSATVPPSCQQSLTAVLGRGRVCRGELLFNEEFDKNNIKDLSNWIPEIMFPQEPDYPFNVYLSDGTLRLENGMLIISPILLETKYHAGFLNGALDLTNTCTGMIGTWECSRTASGAQILPPVATGKITSKNRFNFKYGRVEIRAKLPAGSWLLPEINLEPRDNVYGKTNYVSGLVRIAFAKGNAIYAKKLNGGPILSDLEPYRSFNMKSKIGISNWNKDFHNYSLVWKPDLLEFYVDGDLYGTVDPGEGFYNSANQNGVTQAWHWIQGTVLAPLDQMFYVSLGLRVGGINDFSDVKDAETKPWKNGGRKAMYDFWTAKDAWFPTWYNSDMKIDYVRIYAL